MSRSQRPLPRAKDVGRPASHIFAIVKPLTSAIEHSIAVPPIELDRMLLAIHNSVAISIPTLSFMPPSPKPPSSPFWSSSNTSR